MGVFWKKSNVLTLEEKKTAELNAACKEAIYNGVDVNLNGEKSHFSFTETDQQNIMLMADAVRLGAKQYPYHADKKQVKLYSADNIILIYCAYRKHVVQCTAYCNLLKQWILREKNKEIIGNVTFGSKLPEDLNNVFKSNVSEAFRQIDFVCEQIKNGGVT